MSVSGSSGESLGPDDTADGVRGRGWWVKVGVASLVAPVVMNNVAALILIVVTNSFDPATAMGVSETAVGSIIVVTGGLLAGVVVGLIAGIRGWRLMVPTLAGMIVGLVIFLGLVALGIEGDNISLLVPVGQSAGIFAATSLTGFSVAAAAGAVTLVGIGLGFVLQPASEPPAELFLVLTEEYQVDDANGACSGSGDFSGVAEGSKASVIGTEEVEELEPIVLPSGSEIIRNAESEYLLWNGADTGCLFVLGSQDLGASEYSGTFLFPESLGIGAEEETSGERVVFLFGEF